mgnify:CR=1 FL=1
MIEENVYEERQSNGSNKLDNFIGIFLTAVSISDGSISKMVIGQLEIAVAWFIIGFIHWKKERKRDNFLSYRWIENTHLFEFTEVIL